MRWCCRAYEAGARRQADRSPKRRKMIHNETNPYNARRLVQWHDRQAVVANPPPLPDLAKRRWTASTACPTRAGRIRSYTEPIPAFDDDQGFGHDHARLLRRLHVLLDHRAPRPDHPVAQQRIGAERNRNDDGRSGLQRRRSAISADRPPTCIRCTAQRRKSKRFAGGNRACIPRSASCWAPIMARWSS